MFPSLTDPLCGDGLTKSLRDVWTIRDFQREVANKQTNFFGVNPYAIGRTIAVFEAYFDTVFRM